MPGNATVGEVVRGLGLEGWEMVGSSAGVESRQVLWFRRAMDDVAGPDVRVTLLGMGRQRSDPHQRRLLIDAVAALTGESGWRATRIVDKAPRVVVDKVTPEEAERIRLALEALGAIVEVG
jgi:hypothetical protein